MKDRGKTNWSREGSFAWAADRGDDDLGGERVTIGGRDGRFVVRLVGLAGAGRNDEKTSSCIFG